MNLTLILFWIGILGFVLHRKNIIPHTRKFLLLESYKNVDLIGPAFKSLIEGFVKLTVTKVKLTVTLPLSRFIVSGFFGREVGVNVAQFITSFFVITFRGILAIIAFCVTIFNNILGLKILPKGIINRRFNCRNESLIFYNLVTKWQNVNYILGNKVYFSTCRIYLGDSNNLKPGGIYINASADKEEAHFTSELNKSEKHKLDARERMLKINEAKGIKVEVTDLRTNETTIYNSLRKTAEALSTDLKALRYNENIQKERGTTVPFKKHYIIKTQRYSHHSKDDS